MTQEVTAIERAFQLAEQCASLDEIKAKLKQEGYANVDAHLAGRKIKADLAKASRRQP